MKQLIMKYWKYLLPLVAGIFLGLMINVPSCRKVKPTVKIEYVKGETVHDTCYISVPKINYLKDPITDSDLVDYIQSHPEKFGKDTVTIEISDSLLRKDYFAKRSYEIILFNDSTGECEVNCHVAENELKWFDYTYTPIQKQTTITIPEKRKNVSPFLQVGMGIAKHDVYVPTVGAGAGLVVKDKLMLSVTGQFDLQQGSNWWNVGAWAGYKF